MHARNRGVRHGGSLRYSSSILSKAKMSKKLNTRVQELLALADGLRSLPTVALSH
jgi:hypothetical protein